MNLNKVALDRYITREPYDDGFDNWCENVIELYSDKLWNKIEADGFSEIENQWLNKLFNKSPEEAAKIIERAYFIYSNK